VLVELEVALELGPVDLAAEDGVLQRFPLGLHTLLAARGDPPVPPLGKGGSKTGRLRRTGPPLAKGGYGGVDSTREPRAQLDSESLYWLP
jgi:hypothetical protein